MNRRRVAGEIRFTLRISAEQYVLYYQGAAKNIRARSHEGQIVHFPARVLQPFVTHAGVQGNFVLQFDENHKFLGIQKVGE